MGLTISTNDTRAAFLTGGGATFIDSWGVDASVANGAQNEYTFCDREGLPLARLVRGTSGTTNLVMIDQLGAAAFVNVQSGTTLTASATVVA